VAVNEKVRQANRRILKFSMREKKREQETNAIISQHQEGDQLLKQKIEHERKRQQTVFTAKMVERMTTMGQVASAVMQSKGLSVTTINGVHVGFDDGISPCARKRGRGRRLSHSRASHTHSLSSNSRHESTLASRFMQRASSSSGSAREG
jgi:hypothetical protein